MTLKVTFRLPGKLTKPSEIGPRNVRTREEVRASLVSHYSNPRWNRRLEWIQPILDLDEKYPEVEIFGPQCISAEVGPGWAGLVEKCLIVLKEHGCKATQIKQKFAGLRFYWDFPPHIEEAISEWRKMNPQHLKGDDGEWYYDPSMPFPEERKRISEAVRPVIAEAEELSFRTCEDCGRDLGKSGGPKCGRTQCEECSAGVQW